MTGFTVAHGTVADMTSPTSVPAHLLALDKPAAPDASGDGALRSAIVSVARHYLQLARTRTPTEMESLIWQASSVDGADHGQSCAAFASLTLALGAKAAGQHSWVTGGGSYPWPTSASSPTRPPRTWFRCSPTRRHISAGTRWATATGRGRATGCCSTGTSR
jgi:hypothetical protein